MGVSRGHGVRLTRRKPGRSKQLEEEAGRYFGTCWTAIMRLEFILATLAFQKFSKQIRT